MTPEVIDNIRSTVGGWTVQAAGGGPMDPMDRVRCTLFVEELEGGEGLIDVAMPCTV